MSAREGRCHALRLVLVTWATLAGLPLGMQGCLLAAPDLELTELPGERRCLSLRLLSEHVRAALQSGQPIGEEALNLAGIGRLEGYYIDAENADVVLVGRREHRPSLHLDDLALALALAQHPGDPYCSLDPRQESILRVQRVLAEGVAIDNADSLAHFVDRLQEAIGPQDVVVGRVSGASRWARIMIFADYEMKRISQGLREVPGVRSHLEMGLTNNMDRIARGEAPESEGAMSRFWFHLAKEPTFVESDRILFIHECEVAVLTERQCATADGQLFDGGGDDKCAQAWARQFSIARVAEAVPVCAQLEALYRLLAVARVMELKGAARQVGLDLAFLTDHYHPQDDRPLPGSLQGLANAASAQHVAESENYIYTQASIVCGGVSMETEVRPGNILRNAKTRALLDAVRSLAMRLRPAFGFWWLVNPAPTEGKQGDT